MCVANDADVRWRHAGIKGGPVVDRVIEGQGSCSFLPMTGDPLTRGTTVTDVPVGLSDRQAAPRSPREARPVSSIGTKFGTYSGTSLRSLPVLTRAN